MEFIKSLQEARMTRDERNQKSLTYTDCGNKLYRILLILEFLRQIPTAMPFVQGYCKNTLHHDYKHFKISGTDAYNLLYFLNGDEHALGKLRDPEAAKKMQSQSALPLKDINDFFKNISTGNRPHFPQQMFIRLENGFNINSYRDLRRALTKLEKATHREKKNIATNLLFAARTNLRNSDVIEYFSSVIDQFDLESNQVVDTEPVISNPDITTGLKDVMYYRTLTDSKSLPLIKGFLEYVKNGKSIPAHMVRGYAPIIKIVHEIVSAGPTYVQMLKVLENRAKKSKR